MEKIRPLARAFYLGTVRYKKALKLQHNLVNWNKVQPEVASPTLLLLQHNPVYTIGYRDEQYTDEEQKLLESLGADFVKTDRGGLITFHGPGQLVVYPVFSQLQIEIGVRKYVWLLEEVIINLCKKYNIEGIRSPHTGVWVGNDKICAMGINAQKKTFSHGLALNCNTDMLWFSRIVPCGILDKGVTSLSLQTGRDVTVEEVMPQFLTEMSSVFGWDILPLQHCELDNNNIDDETLFQLITNNEKNETYMGVKS
uniref:putative lipoyltransferase 2, mitochondrial n=1 Tax=Styela clava TaxID=7725 RepID=UPI001939F1E8|nr:putative lipoyltransferase 2, mitochondrial [Styela clava]